MKKLKKPDFTNRKKVPREEYEMKKFFEFLDWEGTKDPIHKLPYHIANAGKFAKGGFYRKMTGVRRGVPDVHVPFKRCGYLTMYIEFKVKPNKLSEEQVWYLDALTKEGHYCIVAWSGDAAIKEYMRYIAGEIT